MAFEVSLPYATDALAPHISKETLEFHFGKHHQGYVTKLNAAVEANADLAGKSLEELMDSQKGGVFNLAAQTWNHSFYWNSMKPGGGGDPTGAIAEAINDSFGDFGKFKAEFSTRAGGHFGSGWAWLCIDNAGKLSIEDTHDADNPLATGLVPLLTCDVWEHAYYIDFRNARPKYIEAWWNLVNWDFANSNIPS
ncbi:MAG: superoxide dismutase [Planctomycetota bacterium]|jgi:Fe-Mn family superoxide dismutase